MLRRKKCPKGMPFISLTTIMCMVKADVKMQINSHIYYKWVTKYLVFMAKLAPRLTAMQKYLTVFLNALCITFLKSTVDNKANHPFSKNGFTTIFNSHT